MKKVFFISIFLFSSLAALGQSTSSVISVKSSKELLSISRDIELLEDKDAQLTIEDIQKMEYQKLFKKSDKDIPNFNTTPSKIWVKLTVENQTDDKIYLELAEALAWYVDFYKPNAEGKLVLGTQTGMMRPMQNREIETNFFMFELSKSTQAQTYYLSIQSEFPLTVPLKIGTAQSILEHRYPLTLFFGMFTGLLLVMFAYNLFIYFSVRDKIYLYYCGYLLSGLFIFNFISGNYGYQWNIISYFPTYLISFNMIGSLFIAPFLFSLLQSQRQQLFFKIVFGFLCVFVLLGLINLVTGHYIAVIDIYQLCVLVVFSYIFVHSLLQYRKGNPSAKFVLSAFSFYLFGAIIFVLQNFGLLPNNFFTHNAIVFGASLEVLMFSLALGDRINAMRMEKENSQKALLLQMQANEKLVKEQNILLEQKVQEKTRDLQHAYEDIQATNEELHQIQDEILAQRDTIQEKNEYLEAYRQKISQSIASALLIQKAILPTEEKIDALLDGCFVINHPKDIVSGDFYWVNQVGGYKFLILGDCTGHGIPGAFMTMIAVGLLDRIIGILNIHQTNHILEALHEQIQKVLQQEKTGNTDGMDILVVRLREKEEHIDVDFAAAKRPLYILSPTDNDVQKIKGSKKMVGGTRRHHENFENLSLVLSKGTTIYLTSDGYIDQNNLERQNFSEKRFLEMLVQIKDKSLPEQKEFLEKTMQEHMIATDQRDDILILAARL